MLSLKPQAGLSKNDMVIHFKEIEKIFNFAGI